MKSCWQVSGPEGLFLLSFPGKWLSFASENLSQCADGNTAEGSEEAKITRPSRTRQCSVISRSARGVAGVPQARDQAPIGNVMDGVPPGRFCLGKFLITYQTVRVPLPDLRRPRLHGSFSGGQMWRQHATANSRSLRSLALPRKISSMVPGSSHPSHCASVAARPRRSKYWVQPWEPGPYGTQEQCRRAVRAEFWIDDRGRFSVLFDHRDKVVPAVFHRSVRTAHAAMRDPIRGLWP